MKTEASKLKSPSLALEMQARMRELEMNPRQLAAQIGHAYDHVRKVYNGQVFPGPYMLRDICKYLKLDCEAMQQKVLADRGRDKGWEKAITGKDATLALFERYWVHLTEQDKDELVAMARLKAHMRLPAKRP
jgi:hypothetical protein